MDSSTVASASAAAGTGADAGMATGTGNGTSADAVADAVGAMTTTAAGETRDIGPYDEKSEEWLSRPCPWCDDERVVAKARARVVRAVPRPRPSPQATVFTIPRLIHHIWLGSPLPAHFVQLRETWRIIHPEWTLMLWDDAAVRKFKLQNQMPYLQALNFGSKSDILRYEILYTFGGVYVDVDTLCCRPLDALHQACLFYTGVSNTSKFELNNAVIGSAPRHPLLLQFIQAVSTAVPPAKLSAMSTMLRTGMLSPAEARPLKDAIAIDTIQSTGPGMFTKTTFQWLCHASAPISLTDLSAFEKNRKTWSDLASCSSSTIPSSASVDDATEQLCLLPPTVFYPLPNHVPFPVELEVSAVIRTLLESPQAAAAATAGVDNVPCTASHLPSALAALCPTPDTICIHYWSCSWQ